MPKLYAPKVHYLLVELNENLIRMDMELEKVKRDNKILKQLLKQDLAEAWGIIELEGDGDEGSGVRGDGGSGK